MDTNNATDFSHLTEENESLKANANAMQETISFFEEEVRLLKEKLNEANSYVDQVDVEAEQQYTEMTAELEELYAVVEKKDAEIGDLREQLSEQKVACKKLTEQLDVQKATTSRQTKVIENLNEELDKANGIVESRTKERDRLNSQITDIRRELGNTKESIYAKEVILNMELDSVKRELEKQRDILNGTPAAALIEKWQRRVLNLEDEVCRRDVIIHAQQAMINRLRSFSPSSPSQGNTSATNSSESFHSNNDESTKSALLSFLMSDNHTQLANVYSIAKLFNLNSLEEQELEQCLIRKVSY